MYVTKENTMPINICIIVNDWHQKSKCDILPDYDGDDHDDDEGETATGVTICHGLEYQCR